MKLHLPVLLRKALLACFSFAFACSETVSAAALTLGSEDSLSIDYAVADSIPDLAGGTLTLNGDTILLLSNCGSGDGKTYTLATGVSGLVDAAGNAITLDSTNNAISRYFDITQPGSGFWADATLVLNEGLLQLVRHNEKVNAFLHVEAPLKDGANYQYYEGIELKNFVNATSESAIHGGTVNISNNGSVIISKNSISSTDYKTVISGAICVGDSYNISLNYNGTVQFSDNSASYIGAHIMGGVYQVACGGAIYGGAHSLISLSQNSNVNFTNNSVSKSGRLSTRACGGAIYGGENSTVSLSNNNNVGFSGNSAEDGGGAIYGASSSTVLLNNNGSVTFSNNATDAYGGSIYGGDSSAISLSYNNNVGVSGNSAEDGGGAIYGASSSTVLLNNNGSVNFSNNATDAYGGAIYGASSSTVLLNNNGSVNFSNNATDAYGGAIYGGDTSTVLLNNNGSVTFSSNSLAGRGGAIYGGISSTISLNNNVSVTFRENSVSYYSGSSSGGAISGSHDSSISLNNNGSVNFRGNSANSDASNAYGGAIYGAGGALCKISLNNNGSVEFSGNSAASSGGAIRGDAHSSISLIGNGSVTFSSNSSDNGGAISGGYEGWISLNNNGRVTFIGNTASSGGAIYGNGSTISLNSNGSVAFSGNTVFSSGGAIRVYDSLSIQNNDSVTFYQNTEVSNGAFRLRSIYVGGIGAVISLSAAVDKSIEFHDSVYIASGFTVNLNADYGDIEQKGDIIFTGATTVDDLYEVKGNVDGTEEEIRLSRTTEVNALTNLYGGRLRVEDGAVYKGNGITAHADSAATVRVKDAELSHEGYDLEFNAGTALEVAGASTIRGNVKLLEKSIFKLEQAATLSLHETQDVDVAALTVNGTALLEGNSTLNASLTLADGATLDMDVLDASAVTLNGALTFAGAVFMGTHLQDILSEMREWEESITLFTGLTNLVLFGSVSEDATGRVWVGDVFSNMAGNQTHYLTYEANVGSLSVVYIPETTTTTLSLLALAGLTMRRRRK